MAEEILELTSGVYRFLEATEEALLHGRRVADEARVRLRERAQLLSQRCSEAAQAASTRASARLSAMADGLRDLVADLEERRSRRRDLRERWKALGRQYEAWVAELKQAREALPAGAELRTLKPRNLWRNVFHASMGLGCVVAYELFMSRTGLLVLGTSVLALFIVMDALRRLAPALNERFVDRVFQKISRPGEAHRIPSATWYVAALTLGTLLLPQHAIEIGALVLALGDPAASLVGRRFGRLKLVGEKSVAGTLGFLTVAVLAITLFAQLALPGLSLGRVLGVAAAAAAAGALAELFSTRVDDNLSIPLAAGMVAMLLL